MQIVIKTKVKASVNEIKQGFNLALFKALNPIWAPAFVLRFDGCNTNDEVHLKLGSRLLGLNWVSKITNSGNPTLDSWHFTDEGLVLPFFLKKWKHQHIVSGYEEFSIITDQITYQTPWFVPKFIVHPLLHSTFAYRYSVYQKFFGKPN